MIHVMGGWKHDTIRMNVYIVKRKLQVPAGLPTSEFWECETGIKQANHAGGPASLDDVVDFRKRADKNGDT